MLDERKVKLMTKLALYEEGKEDFKISPIIEKIMQACTLYMHLELYQSVMCVWWRCFYWPVSDSTE